MDPQALVEQVMEIARDTGRCGAPHVIRMLPVQLTCSARTVEALAEAAAPLVETGMHGYAGPYAVHWRRRYNKEIDKMKVIDAVATLVKATAPKAAVDLSHAQMVRRLP